jgi:trk system potassium uptake protein TrkH
VLSSTLVLLTAGALGWLIFEWDDSMAGLSIPVKAMAALFQSITTRTAGFNTLDFGEMANVTLLFTILLMFVGASSGSCAGGIKINTLGVLFALSRSRLRGERTTSIFHRSIAPASIDRAIAVFVVSVVVIYVATTALMASEVGAAPHAQTRGLFLELLFEVVSAFGTVGLSMGVTPELSSLGRCILVVVMFVGRLGPLSIVVGLSGKERGPQFHYAEEDVMIG